MVIATPSRLEPLTLSQLHALNVLTDGVRRRRQAYLEARPCVDSERTRLLTESWEATEGQPLPIRRARALEHILGYISVVIHPGELVVGSQSRHLRGCHPPVEWMARRIVEELSGERLTTAGMAVEATSDEEDRRINVECARSWERRSIDALTEEAWQRTWGTTIFDAFAARLFTCPYDGPPSTRSPNYEQVVNVGLAGVLREIEEEMARTQATSPGDIHKIDFLTAAAIGCRAVIAWARRHAEEARRLAAQESNPARRAELERIAQVCEWVPEHPARSFHEAVQSFWFTLMASRLETAANNDVPGRLDQILHPCYDRDLREGRATRQEAIELLGCLWTKFVELESYKDPVRRETTQGSEFINVTICGLTENGRDATNELSYLILETERQLRYHQPHISLRFHEALPEDILIQAVECNRAVGGGIPAFFNEKPALVALCEKGVPLKEARKYWIPMGCVERKIANSSGGMGAPHVSLAKCLELALYNGWDPYTQKMLGPQTGDPRSFPTYDRFVEAVKQQFAAALTPAVDSWNMYMVLRGDHYQMPFTSALMNDCIARGKDILSGGLRYPQFMLRVLPFGHVNLADSLTAIRKLVYEDKSVTWDELLAALRADFEGYEDLRRRLLSAPKYGNDDDAADAAMTDIYAWTEAMVKAQHGPTGHKYGVSRQGTSLHYHLGKTSGPLPDGSRKAYEPLGDGSLSAMRGADRKGPTAILNSAAKVDVVGSNGTLLNIKFHPKALEGRDGARKLLSLVRTYFDRWGLHVQFNILDPAVLLEAKKHPEQYRDLVVRVAGYSAYFVELAPEVQDEIIERTTHQFC